MSAGGLRLPQQTSDEAANVSVPSRACVPKQQPGASVGHHLELAGAKAVSTPLDETQFQTHSVIDLKSRLKSIRMMVQSFKPYASGANLSDSNSSFAILLHRANAGESDAVDRLLASYRDRLKSMVKVHMDNRLARRFDASDVVQDSLFRAAQRLDQFEKAKVPFYVWLRQIAHDRLSELYERHVHTQKRSVLREQAWGLSQDSISRLAVRLVDADGAVVDQAIQREMQQRLRLALKELPQQQREIVVMRYLEQMTVAEIAAACDLSEGAVKMRQLRTIENLRRLLHS